MAQDTKSALTPKRQPRTLATLHIPLEMRCRSQWVNWKFLKRGNKTTKPPINPKTGHFAKPDNPTTWTDFETAINASKRIGYVFTADDGLLGIDLDGARNPETGKAQLWARQILEGLRSWQEVSPSGTGYHVIVKAGLDLGAAKRKFSLPEPAINGKQAAVELFSENAYFTITQGKGEIEERTTEMNLLLCTLEAFPKASTTLPQAWPFLSFASCVFNDIETIDQARTKDAKLDALWNGENPSGDASGDDFVFFKKLAHFLDADLQRIFAAAMESGRVREKWQNRPGYVYDTIAKALKSFTPAASGLAKAKTKGFNVWSILEAVNELGNGRVIADMVRERLLFVPELDGWLLWKEGRWRKDSATELFAARSAHDLPEYWKERAQIIRHEADKQGDEAKKKELNEQANKVLAWSHQCKRRGIRIKAIADSKAMPDMARSLSRCDVNPWLFATRNRILDLKTGTAREARREDYITRGTEVRYDPFAKCPRWLQFLEEIEPDEERRAYLQRVAGYCLTGSVREQAFFIFQGEGANGKSTFLDTLLSLFGDLGGVCDTAVLVSRRREQSTATPSLMKLRGLRFAVAHESDEGCRLNSAQVKSLTGGDTIFAREVHQKATSFRPMFKLFLVTNHRPRIADTSHGLWRRLQLFRFGQTISKARIDGELGKKLKTELSGILNWTLEGLKEWKRLGLKPPASVLEGKEEYQESEDDVARFIGDCCAWGTSAVAATDDLSSAYRAWAEAEGLRQKPLRRLIPEILAYATRLGQPCMRDRLYFGGRRRRVLIGLSVHVS